MSNWLESEEKIPDETILDEELSDEMDFLLDDEESESSKVFNYWNVMIIDDDRSVHEATKYALSGFRFLDKTIKWYDAYSASEAQEILEKERDMAILFLDVVMETDHAGLTFAKWFRDEQINSSTRIILRTGQPGQAPERQIIVNYDLHDYKTKTELSSDKLFTTTVSALRSYNDISRLEATKAGLEGVINASKDLFQMQSMYEYSKNVLSQIGSILDIRSSGIICAQSKKNSEWELLAQTGTFNNDFEQILTIITDCATKDNEEFESDHMVKILAETTDLRYAIYLEPLDQLNDIQLQMLLMFCTNISIGISNIKLYNNLLNAHKSTVMSLAQITESRDQETGEHVFRISRGTEILAKELYNRHIYESEIDSNVLETIGLSSTLHDLGKIAVPDAILLKPGKLTKEEFDVIKQHPVQGAKILQNVIDNTGDNDIDYLTMGKRIALYHHERWDGKGYPEGISGETIPVEARITAIIDVFDALINKRCYKSSYPIQECLDIIREGRGTAFDPLIVDVFLEIVDDMCNNVWMKID